MKTNKSTIYALLVLAAVVTIAFLSSCTAGKVAPQARYVQVVNEPLVYFYSYSQSGTLTINKSDGIAGVSIIVPSSATDTVIFRGGTRTVDGKAVGYGRVSPGTSLGLGYNELQRLDSVTVTIRAHSMPTIILTPVK